MTDEQQLIIDRISAELARQARQCAAEQEHPARNPDASDDFIRERKKAVARLQGIRGELELLFTGMLP